MKNITWLNNPEGFIKGIKLGLLFDVYIIAIILITTAIISFINIIKKMDNTEYSHCNKGLILKEPLYIKKNDYDILLQTCYEGRRYSF